MSEMRFEFLVTNDGSPSLRVESAEQAREAMHHTGGALSESVYIYYGAFEKAAEIGSRRRVLSVGLGLGYNELLMVAGWLRSTGIDDAFLHSFESESVLRDAFIQWLVHRENHVIQGIPMGQIYESVAYHVGGRLQIPPAELKLALRRLYSENRFVLSGPLGEETTFPTRYDVILFDAFSHKATPLLWSESFLESFLDQTAAKTCTFATYAATGALRRALTKCGFHVDKHPGFSGKRESTLAYRRFGDTVEP